MMERYVAYWGVGFNKLKAFAESTTGKRKGGGYGGGELGGRAVKDLDSAQISKEELARELAWRDKIKEGLIAIFTAVEPCLSYSIRGDHETKKTKLVLETRKCTHFYHYYLHPEFGQLHVRVQSWFPFSVDVCLNGREWLARQMYSAGIDYEQRDNGFVWVSDQGGG